MLYSVIFICDIGRYRSAKSNVMISKKIFELSIQLNTSGLNSCAFIWHFSVKKVNIVHILRVVMVFENCPQGLLQKFQDASFGAIKNV